MKLLGDVHLGKKFKMGVPLHRRGEREEMIWKQLFDELIGHDESLHIQVGDLFDDFIVSYGTIFRAALMYRKAARTLSSTTFVVLRGNHDASNDIERVSAFMLFKEMVRGVENISVVDEHPQFFKDEKTGMVMSVVPWHPIVNAEDMVANNPYCMTGAHVAVGHWDVDRRQEGGSNYIPAKRLVELGVTRAITGHDHNAREEKIGDLRIQVVGSMQPYSHAEDSDERFYVTRSLADVLADPDAYRDKHLRVVLAPGEVLDLQIDCLQLTQVREGEETEVDLGEVEFETYDFDALLTSSINEAGLRADVATALIGKIQEAKMGEADVNSTA